MNMYLWQMSDSFSERSGAKYVRNGISLEAWNTLFKQCSSTPVPYITTFQ